MATETFFKEIILDEAAVDRLIAEMEKPRKPHVPEFDVLEELKRGEEWLQQRISQSEKSSEQIKK